MKALDRKLLRDLSRMKGQVLTIALVVACGVATFLTFVGAYRSLEWARDTFYAQTRFADVFAVCVRAPVALERELSQLSGVAQVETRISAAATLDMPNVDEPIRGHLVSVSTGLNTPLIRQGRAIDGPEEALVAEAFAKAHGLRPGDPLHAVIDGRRRTFRVVGLALSPEYVFAIAPGSVTFDDRRYGVVWVDRASLAAAVGVAKIERGEFVEAVEEPGKTRVRERFVVSAPVSGELARIQKKPGDAVEANEVLLTIRPVAPAMMDARQKGELEARLQAALAALTLSNASVDKAKTVLSYAQKEVARLKSLADKGAIPERDLEKAELELRVAEKDLKTAELSAHVALHEVDVARSATSATTKTETAWLVRSPLKGRVLRVLQLSEGVIAAGTPLLEVADPTDLEVVVAVLTADAIRIAPGARSLLDRWGGPTALEGRVRSIEPSGYTKLSALGVEEQRVDVVIDIMSPGNLWSMLGDGFRVHTRTIVFRQPDALKTSAATLFRDGDAWALFVVQGGKAGKRRVTVDRRNGPEVMLSGIEPGVTVINFPTSALSDGAAVAIR